MLSQKPVHDIAILANHLSETALDELNAMHDKWVDEVEDRMEIEVCQRPGISYDV